MAQKQKRGLKSLSIRELVNDKLLYGKVLTLLEQKRSYDYIINYLASKGYHVAKGSLTNLKKKINLSRQKGIPMDKLVDKRRKSNKEDSIDDVPAEKVSGFTGEELTASGKVMPVYSAQQVMESLISKGYKSIEESDFVDPKTLMSALTLYMKYFGQKSRGLTSEGLKQYQIVMQSEQLAMQQVFFQYIPKDKQKEAYRALKRETDKVLDQLGATKEGKELLKQLREADLPLA